MSEPSDELLDEAKSEMKTRSSGRTSGAKSDLEKMKEARAKSGVNRANVRLLMALLHLQIDHRIKLATIYPVIAE